MTEIARFGIMLICLFAWMPRLTAAADRYVVFGVDRSESLQVLTCPALAVAEYNLVRWAKDPKQGTALWLRWISHRSYATDELFGYAHWSAEPQIECPKSRFDPKARRCMQQALQLHRKAKAHRLAQAKRLQQEIHTLYTSPLIAHGTPRTDIVGFIEAAAEQLSSAPADAERHIVMATDLGDNKGFELAADLHGLQVDIYYFDRQANPDAARVRKAQWKKRLEGLGAQVHFLPVPELVMERCRSRTAGNQR